MSEKKKKNVLPATEPTPTEPQAPKGPATEEDQQVAEEIVEAKPFQLIPPFKISGKAKGMAKAAGVDLSGVEEMAPRINDWASSVEERLNIIISTIPNLPAQTIELLKAEAEKQRAEIMQRQQTAPQQPPAQGGDLMNMIAQVAPMFLGGGSNPLAEKSEKLMGVLLDKALETVMRPSTADAFSKAFDEAYIQAKAKALAAVVVNP